MTTHHPSPDDERSLADQNNSSDGSRHLDESARDMRSMHTRLADLLDQVSVNTPPAADETLGDDSAVGDSSLDSLNGANSYDPIWPEPLTDGIDKPVLAQEVDNPYSDPLSGFPETKHESNGQNGLDSAFGSVTAGSIAGTATAGAATTGQGSLASSVFGQSTSTQSELDRDEPKEPLSSLSEPRMDDIGRNGMSDEIEGPDTMDTGGEKMNSAITIKGRTDGIAIEIGAGGWRMLMVQLRQRLHQSSGFFRGGIVSLDVGSRSLSEEEMVNAQEVLQEHGLKLGMVRTLAQETSQTAAALGVAVTLEQPEASVSQSASTNHDSLAHFVYRGNLRSGQILRRSETILILGDVNPGAHVESDADILVWGRLRGIAHAGATGDVNSIVAAMSMEPTQLRINDEIAIMPTSDDRRTLFGAKKRNPNLAPRPEVAYIADDTIVVEPWDESKPGGIMAFRRS